ncbi:MAG: hypothetical protein DRQ78_01285 [Epsilonproteobacteria bacterium]|nr:MAG: hypothetical protein DRQ78_01285 [Campylobacterota bacterium]
MTTKKTTKTTTKKTRYTTITQRAEIYLASKIRNEIQTTIDIYQMIESYAKSGDKDLRKTILILIEEHKSNYDKLLSITLGNFMKSPLGKDLRRNVAYMNIVNELNRIVNLSDSVVNFIYKTNNLELKDKT